MRTLLASTLLSACLLAWTPLMATASHWRVDIAGGADFTSIQAALDAGGRDSILVAPGVYPETLLIAKQAADVTVIGDTSPEPISVFGLRSSPSMSYTVRIEGIKVLGSTDLGTSRSTSFRRCWFYGFVESRSQDGPANFENCDFMAPTRLLDYSSHGEFRNLRFHSAPLFVRTSATGPSHFIACEFNGPADTLVVASLATGDNAISFLDCTFSNAGAGVFVLPTSQNTPSFERCHFQSLEHDALAHDSDDDDEQGEWSAGLDVDSVSFQNVGSAIRWHTSHPSNIRLSSVVVRDCESDAIRVRPVFYVDVQRLVRLDVQDCGGSGLVIDRPRFYPFLLTCAVDSSRFVNCAGDGMRFESPDQDGDNLLATVTATTSAHNGGSGFALHRTGTRIEGNLALDNQRHGIELRADITNGNRADTVLSNTSVGNGGDGIRVMRSGAGLSQAQFVTRNIAALNGQTGIRVHSPNSATDNLSWHNYLSESVGFPAFLDSNLVADPRFCDLSGGDFTLQSDSPAAPNAEHELIGALAVACASTVAVGPSAPPRIWTFGPNPSRGAVTFALTPTVSGRLEVFDALGRRVWSQRVAAGEIARWDGTENGRAAPGGLYQARLVTSSGVQQAKLIRLP